MKYPLITLCLPRGQGNLCLLRQEHKVFHQDNLFLPTALLYEKHPLNTWYFYFQNWITPNSFAINCQCYLFYINLSDERLF